MSTAALRATLKSYQDQLAKTVPGQFPPMPEWPELNKKLEAYAVDPYITAFFRAVAEQLLETADPYNPVASLPPPTPTAPTESAENAPEEDSEAEEENAVKAETLPEPSQPTATEVAQGAFANMPEAAQAPIAISPCKAALNGAGTYVTGALFSLADFFDEEPVDHVLVQSSTGAEQALIKLWIRELNWMSDNIGMYGPLGAHTLQKLTQAITAFAEGKNSDVTTILKAAQASDKQNRTLSFLFSQLQYYRARQGSTSALHEAREEAKRACVYADNFDGNKLLYYRYMAALIELPFDPQKSLEQLRSYYLINPESLQSDEGLWAHDGIHFKSLILLSLFKVNLLEDFEINAITEITQRVEGGVPLYLALFRPKLKELITARGPYREKLLELEQALGTALHMYNLYRRELEPYHGQHGRSWFAEVRFLQFFATPALPSFTDIFLYSSLDARRVDAESAPTETLRGNGLNRTYYWHVWAQSITPYDELRNNQALPVMTVKSWAPLTELADQMLTELTSAENALIDADKWSQVEALLPSWEMNQLISIGNGSSTSVATYAPLLQPFQTYFFTWVRAAGQAKKHAELIGSSAGQGAFGSPKHIFLAFSGASALLTDPNYNHKAMIHKAWQQYKGAGSKGGGFGGGDAVKQYGMFLLVVPIAGLTFFLMVASANVGSAMALFGVVLAMLIGVGLLLSSRK